MVLGILHYLCNVCFTLNIFASGTARITALFSAFAAILVAMGTPIPFTILLFGLMNGPGCTLPHYSSGVTPIFFGAGYVPQGTLSWRVGLAISMVSFLIHFWGGTLGMWFGYSIMPVDTTAVRDFFIDLGTIWVCYLFILYKRYVDVVSNNYLLWLDRVRRVTLSPSFRT